MARVALQAPGAQGLAAQAVVWQELVMALEPLSAGSAVWAM
jgi:hypothetical protein